MTPLFYEYFLQCLALSLGIKKFSFGVYFTYLFFRIIILPSLTRHFLANIYVVTCAISPQHLVLQINPENGYLMVLIVGSEVFYNCVYDWVFSNSLSFYCFFFLSLSYGPPCIEIHPLGVCICVCVWMNRRRLFLANGCIGLNRKQMFALIPN